MIEEIENKKLNNKKVKWQIIIEIYGEKHTINCNINNEIIEQAKASKEQILNLIEGIIKSDVDRLVQDFKNS